MSSLGISGYTHTDYVHNTEIYALEDRIQDYKNKWHNHILRMDS
jgi:hypothetical protein